MGKVLRITSRLDGFRRAGVAHPARPVDHPIDRFTKSQRAALEGDPRLIVQEVELPDDTPRKETGRGGKQAATPANGGKRRPAAADPAVTGDAAGGQAKASDQAKAATKPADKASA